MDSYLVFDAYPKVSLSEFFDELTFEFTEMPEAALGHYLLRVINRFARDSNALRRMATVHIQPCVDAYLVDPQDCMEIVAILGATLQQCGCHHTAVLRNTSGDCAFPGGVHLWFEPPNVIHLTGARDGDLRVKMSVAPVRHACEVDAELLTKHYDVIINGVKSLLFAMSEKPWSNVQRAQEYEARFVSGIRAAGIEAMTGGQRGVFQAKRPRVL